MEVTGKCEILEKNKQVIEINEDFLVTEYIIMVPEWQYKVFVLTSLC